MLAREFASFEQSESVIIFASGVSNSQEQNPAEYAREIELLLSLDRKNKKLVYFSTISIYDPELAHSAYIKHKLQIEKLIAEEFSTYIIFRLPQLVGKTNNPHTLCNFLYNKIMAGETITVFEHACRYLMDVSDVYKWLTPLINSDSIDNSIVNVNLNNKISIQEVINLFETVCSRKANRNNISKGSCYSIPHEFLIDYLNNLNLNVSKDYNLKTIAKYYSDPITN